MDLSIAREFFGWCAILNSGLLLFSFMIIAFAGDWVYRMHSKWHDISRESFNVVVYSLLAFIKTVIFIFNIVPYVALMIITS